MVTLESAKRAFTEWRASKTGINTPAPEKLWKMVEQLLLTHKRSEICKVLRISSRQIQSHCTTSQITEGQERTSLQSMSDFVVATLPANVGMVELTLKGGAKSLHLYLPISALCEVLPMFGTLL